MHWNLWSPYHRWEAPFPAGQTLAGSTQERISKCTWDSTTQSPLGSQLWLILFLYKRMNAIGYPAVCYSHVKAMFIMDFDENKMLERFKGILTHVLNKHDEASTQTISIKLSIILLGHSPGDWRMEGGIAKNGVFKWWDRVSFQKTAGLMNDEWLKVANPILQRNLYTNTLQEDYSLWEQSI